MHQFFSYGLVELLRSLHDGQHPLCIHVELAKRSIHRVAKNGNQSCHPGHRHLHLFSYIWPKDVPRCLLERHHCLPIQIRLEQCVDVEIDFHIGLGRQTKEVRLFLEVVAPLQGTPLKVKEVYFVAQLSTEEPVHRRSDVGMVQKVVEHRRRAPLLCSNDHEGWCLG